MMDGNQPENSQNNQQDQTFEEVVLMNNHAVSADGEQSDDDIDIKVRHMNGTIQENPPIIIDKEAFILAVEKFPCIWNHNIPEYRDRNMNNNSWQVLSNYFNESGKRLRGQP